MSQLGLFEIDDYVTFPANTHDPADGAASDVDGGYNSGVPAYRIYEDETATPIATGSMAKLDDANTLGFYSERVQLTAAAGFEVGKCYTIYISAQVNSILGTMHHTFRVGRAYSDDVQALLGCAGGKKVVSADGLTVELYDRAGVLLVTLVRSGAGPYTWTPTWA